MVIWHAGGGSRKGRGEDRETGRAREGWVRRLTAIDFSRQTGGLFVPLSILSDFLFPTLVLFLHLSHSYPPAFRLSRFPPSPRSDPEILSLSLRPAAVPCIFRPRSLSLSSSLTLFSPAPAPPPRRLFVAQPRCHVRLHYTRARREVAARTRVGPSSPTRASARVNGLLGIHFCQGAGWREAADADPRTPVTTCAP